MEKLVVDWLRVICGRLELQKNWFPQPSETWCYSFTKRVILTSTSMYVHNSNIIILFWVKILYRVCWTEWVDRLNGGSMSSKQKWSTFSMYLRLAASVSTQLVHNDVLHVGTVCIQQSKLQATFASNLHVNISQLISKITRGPSTRGRGC